MKICIFTNHFYPEDFKVNDIAFEMQKIGHEVTVITAIPDYPSGKFFNGYGYKEKREEIVNGVKVIRLFTIPRGNGGGKRLLIQYMAYHMSSTWYSLLHSSKPKYDLVFVHETSPFFIGNPAARIAKKQHIPLIFWTLDLWPESITAAAGIKSKFIIFPLIKMVQSIYNKCDKILIGSKGYEKNICEKGNFKNKMIYFPNWSETTDMPSDTSSYESVKPFSDQKENDFIFLFAGNLGVSQNIECIISASIEFRNQENIKFVFIGDGRDKNNLQLIAEQEGLLNTTVFFPGRFPLESMPYFMSKASALLVSLKDEEIFNLTVPSKVQFYMAQGKPIIAMLNGDGADLINEAECGITVAANDRDGFVKAIRSFTSLSKGDILRMGRNGKNYYNQNFEKKLRINQLNELFKNCYKIIAMKAIIL